MKKHFDGLQTIVDQCSQEKWIRIVEKDGVPYISKADLYKLRFIFHLRNKGVDWKDVPQYLTPEHLYSVEDPGQH